MTKNLIIIEGGKATYQGSAEQLLKAFTEENVIQISIKYAKQIEEYWNEKNDPNQTVCRKDDGMCLITLKNIQQDQLNFVVGELVGRGADILGIAKEEPTLEEVLFEQLLIKPTHLSSILFWRTICWLIIQTVEVVMVLMIIKIIFHTPMGSTIEIIPIFIVTMMGLMGLSFLLSSLTLLYTKTASFDAIIGYILLFFTGIISGDVTNKGISYYVLPLSQGIQLSRDFINNKQVDLGQFAFLLVNTLVYLLIGFLLFKYAMKKGRKSGVSSEY